MNAVKAVHDKIPTMWAWQVGRLGYVACRYKSTLGARLRTQMDAHRDRDRKRL